MFGRHVPYGERRRLVGRQIVGWQLNSWHEPLGSYAQIFAHLPEGVYFVAPNATINLCEKLTRGIGQDGDATADWYTASLVDIAKLDLQEFSKLKLAELLVSRMASALVSAEYPELGHASILKSSRPGGGEEILLVRGDDRPTEAWYDGSVPDAAWARGTVRW